MRAPRRCPSPCAADRWPVPGSCPARARARSAPRRRGAQETARRGVEDVGPVLSWMVLSARGDSMRPNHVSLTFALLAAALGACGGAVDDETIGASAQALKGPANNGKHFFDNPL